MRTIRIPFDEALLADVDRAASELGASRSVFVRAALEAALHHHHMAMQEARHATEYARQPQTHDEVTERRDEQIWDEL